MHNNTTPNNKPSTSKNRNSMDLFYEPDDDKQTDKIDRLMAHRKEQEKEEQKKKEKEEQEKQKNTPSSSTKKRNHDKIEKTPKKKKEDIDKKQKNNEEPKIKKQCLKKPAIRKPFGQLLSGVVFTISGIVNPERASLREKALEMGAKYKPSWDNYCTHLM